MSIAILSTAELQRSLAHGEGRDCAIDARQEEEFARGHIPIIHNDLLYVEK